MTKRALSYDEAREIRDRYAHHAETVRSLASKFGVSQTVIWRIVNYEAYVRPSQFEVV